MKKTKALKVINLILSVYLSIYFVLVNANMINTSVFVKVMMWTWFATFTFSLIGKAIKQIEEMQLIKLFDNEFSLLEQLSLSNRLKGIEFVHKSATELIAKIDEAVNDMDLKRYNQKHLEEMKNRLNTLLASISES